MTNVAVALLLRVPEEPASFLGPEIDYSENGFYDLPQSHQTNSDVVLIYLFIY
jgi:hypothetical protein